VRKDVREYPWGALWFVGTDPERGVRRELFQAVHGARRMIGLLPTGRGPTGDEPLVSLFDSMRGDRYEAFRSAPIDMWKRGIANHMPEATGVLDQIRSHDDLVFTRYLDVQLDPWHAHRVVYLGDAAHAMSPQLGQGANLALWDALSLADALAANSSIDAALSAYSSTRRSHLRWYRFASRWLTPFFQSDLPLDLVRDIAMPIAMRIPPLRRLILRTLCGVAQGTLGMATPIELPALPSGGKTGRRDTAA
jgi:2-polyprenyl-6-methoxyphenol hydroxylase-like FAD-dependent oxidoreductase